MHKGWYKDCDEDDDNGFAQFGGYMAAKKAKLIQQVRTEATERTDIKSELFKDIAIYVNGYTKPSSEELRNLMAEHSGTFHIYQMPSTTHIIASNLPNVKIAKLGSLPIVKPGWIEDSITLGRLLDYSNYLLYTNHSRTQPKLAFPTKTASDPDFLAEFYSNSRLHLISTLGSEFKQLVTDWRRADNPSFTGRQRLVLPPHHTPFATPTIIMHIDMDCFFVSVGIRGRSDLIGQAVAVTHSKGSDHVTNSSLSEVASCSYEARACGVRNGMFMGQALQLCPKLIAIPYDFAGYRKVAHILYSTLAEYTLDIEPVSCDEMYVNVGSLLYLGVTVPQWAQHIRAVIRERTGCPCSTGFGANRLQARLATKLAKPDGWYHLVPEAVADHMRNLKLSDLPGVGRATLAKLSALGLETCGDVEPHISGTLLRSELGAKMAQQLLEQVRGEDGRRLQYEHERKSVSAEVNYGIRFTTMDEVRSFLQRLVEEVCTRLGETGMKAKCVTLKLMTRAADAPIETPKYLGHGVCDTVSKSTSLPQAVASGDGTILVKHVLFLYEKLNVPFAELRGVGVQLTRLEGAPKVNKVLKNFLNRSATDGKQKESKTSSLMVRPEVKDKRSTSKDLTHFFKTTKKPSIDLSVLNELPPDIRSEVIKEYGLESTLEEPLQPDKVGKVKQRSSSGFAHLSHERFIDMLAKWMQCHAKPLQVDVDMLMHHFAGMVQQRHIERLLVYIRFLHRHISGMQTPEWSAAYQQICESLQVRMLCVYGKPLNVPKL